VRIVRLTRAFRLQRIIRFVTALRTLIYSIASTLKSLFWAIILTTIIIYVFSLAFTMEALDALENGGLEGETQEALSKAWGTLFRSMSTLFQSISGGVSWRDVIGPLADASRISSFLFPVYISFTTFAVLNVVTGVFCSTALEATQRNPDLVARNILDKRRETSRLLENLFTAIDDDDSGLITLDELHAISEDDMVRAYFQAMDIDFRDAWTLFKLIDSKSSGEVPLQEFLLACEQLRGGATNMHVSELSYDIRKLHMNVCKLGRVVKDRLLDVPGGSVFTEPLQDNVPTDDNVSAL
jgi:Ca2+-binding EF-hand superfamily protein